MDFKDTPEEAAFRAEVRAWLEANAEPLGDDDRGRGRDTAEHIERAKAFQRKLFEHGWAGITWPEEYGGRGEGAMQATIWGQETSGYDIPTGPFTVAIGFAGPTLIHHGSEEQKERYLRPMLAGEEIWCQLFSEPEAGSDLASLTTRAVREGDEYVVNGQKVWTSGAQYADFGILLARTDPDVPKHAGITYFVVDMRTPGIEVRPLHQLTGEAHFSEVFLTDVRIPASNVVGDVNDGWRVAMTTFLYERSHIGGGMSGPEFPALLRMARNAGRTTDPVVRQSLADVYVRSQIMRYLGFRVQTAASQGRAPGTEASIMKLAFAKLLRRSGDVALAVEGPEGMLAGDDAPDGGRWQYAFLTAPAIRIAGGTDDIQRNIIGERVLGLPREPRVDKDVPFRDLASRP